MNTHFVRDSRTALLCAVLTLPACGGSSSPPAAPTVTVSASANSIIVGTTVTLRWSSSNAQSCQATGQWAGPLPLSGSKTLDPPAALSEFGIVCNGSGGSATANASVAVVLPHYTVTTSVNSHGEFYGADALNDFGGVAGWFGIPYNRQAPPIYDISAWTSGSAPPLAAPPPGQDPLVRCQDQYTGTMCPSHATGINTAGETVVTVISGPLGQFAMHYGPGYVVVIPGLLSAYAINDADTIVGQTPALHAGVFASGTTVDLGTLGGSESDANAVNNSGTVVGSAMLAGDAVWHAFLSNGTGLVDLNDLGGGYSSAEAVNDAGVVVGGAKTSAGETHAFRYADGQMVDIGVGAGASSAASGINNANLIVGAFVPVNSTDGQLHPFLYGNGKMFDLMDVAYPQWKSDPAGDIVMVGPGDVRINHGGQILIPLCMGSTNDPVLACSAILLTPAASP
jgi:probable HAF family extracellular repeat protein